MAGIGPSNDSREILQVQAISKRFLHISGLLERLIITLTNGTPAGADEEDKNA